MDPASAITEHDRETVILHEDQLSLWL